jgi:hypothetical protein
MSLLSHLRSSNGKGHGCVGREAGTLQFNVFVLLHLFRVNPLGFDPLTL